MLAFHKLTKPAYRLKIGNRDIVGPSVTCLDEYFDRVDAPCPPIRFKRPSKESDILQAKEKGSWTALTLDDKKNLYRYSFRQTLAEAEAPTAEWRAIFGDVMLMLCIPLLVFVVMKKTVFPPMPDSMSDLGKKKLVRYYIDANADPMPGGLTSKWDYEKQEWKEKPFFLMKKN